MHYVTRFLVVVCAGGLASTLLPLEFWQMSPAALTVNRVFFVLIIALSLIFNKLSANFLKTPEPNYKLGRRYVGLFIAAVLVSSIFVTVVNYPFMKRYFFLLSAAIVVFDLFFIPPVGSLICMAITALVSFVGLTHVGSFNSVQAITLLTYLMIIEVVSAASFYSRLNSARMGEEAHNNALHDKLTGVLNRRALEEDIHLMVGGELFVIISDIDDFKSYNDLFGHDLGDIMLKGYADAMVRAFGAQRVYRYGGDEFVAVVQEGSWDSVNARIASWREDFHNIELPVECNRPTCSVGCVRAWPKDRTEFLEALHVADVLLYRAKESGRDRVETSDFTSELLARALAKSNDSHMEEVKRDPLTGLTSFDYFCGKVDKLLGIYVRKGKIAHIVYFNIVGLKDYNAAHGFDAGDDLLRYVAISISETFPSGLCSRTSGDRFVLLADGDGLVERLERVQSKVREYKGSHLTALRAGITRYTGRGEDVRAACDRAKLASDSISGQYGVTYCFYTEELGRRAAQRKNLLERFDSALEQGRIHVYYQPIVRTVSDLICEFETLARWELDDGTVVEAVEFVPSLEDVRVVHLLDLYVVDLVCKNHMRMVEAGIEESSVCVNLSSLDFETDDFVEQLAEVLNKHHMPPEALRMEITESAFMDDANLVHVGIDKLHELGIQVWMDDFTSGYSSLSVLRDSNFDAVKVDVSFLQGLDESERGQRSKVMLEHVVGMGKELGMQTVAEGVETLEQMLFLRSIGCEKLQGYVFGAPVSFDSLIENVRNNVFYLEDKTRAHYYDTVGRVNLLKPFDTATEPDPTGVADGLPVAVLEWDGMLLHYLLTSKVYLNNLHKVGMSDVVDSEIRMNGPDGSHNPLRAAIPRIAESDGWVTVGYEDIGSRGVGYARKIATCAERDAFAFMFVAPVAMR